MTNVFIIIALAVFLIIRFRSRWNSIDPHFDVWIGKLKHYMLRIGCSEMQVEKVIPSLWRTEYDANRSPEAAYWHRAYIMAMKSYRRVTLK